MDNLSAAKKLQTNPDVVAKVESAIRITAAARYEWAGKAGQLAKVSLLDPTIPLAFFAAYMSTNSTITADACPSCGYAWHTADGDIDAAIMYVVGDRWEAVANKIYPDAS